MAIRIDGEERRIGLALSGGGFRAAAFHLGTFRKLKELGLLDRIDLFSCVSGGSIAGAFLCTHWGQPDVLDRLETYLRTKSIAISSVLGGFISPFSTRLEKLADTYERDLFGTATLASLQDGPRIYLNATNLASGNMFFFVAGGGANEDIMLGEHELGQVPAKTYPISRAVAASSAFPPVFPPLTLDQTIFPNSLTDYVSLTDGGVYDNLGVNPLLRMERNHLSYAIVSDGGKPFSIDPDPTESGTIVLKEAINILMEQVRGLQFQRLELAHAAGRGPKPMWFSIDADEKGKLAQDAAFASSISTNLKALTETELAVLTRHAGALCEARIRKYAPELLG
ncbi:patatin-like phospholipase family protein [Roseibium litorale]|uniref:Patatin-like phospholipase family protein n=1 Tax=Roseibium litorale TaxID=2803841 RepID=A0ABR9CM97_9HYPH|nr:patatin-like phospholipase family protein [Roseibium litorale]MBD8891838.1 patatin-like phospholipase family protein [Roseibium litorale]